MRPSRLPGVVANDRWRTLAIQEFQKVFELNPSNTEALKSLAHRYYWSAKHDEAKRYYRKTLEVDTNDPEALYTLAVIQWQRSYQLRQERRVELNLSREKPLIALPACTEIRAQNLTRVEEAISLLTRVPEASDFPYASGGNGIHGHPLPRTGSHPVW